MSSGRKNGRPRVQKYSGSPIGSKPKRKKRKRIKADPGKASLERIKKRRREAGIADKDEHGNYQLTRDQERKHQLQGHCPNGPLHHLHLSPEW